MAVDDAVLRLFGVEILAVVAVLVVGIVARAIGRRAAGRRAVTTVGRARVTSVPVRVRFEWDLTRAFPGLAVHDGEDVRFVTTKRVFVVRRSELVPVFRSASSTSADPHWELVDSDGKVVVAGPAPAWAPWFAELCDIPPSEAPRLRPLFAGTTWAWRGLLAVMLAAALLFQVGWVTGADARVVVTEVDQEWSTCSFASGSPDEETSQTGSVTCYEPYPDVGETMTVHLLGWPLQSLAGNPADPWLESTFGTLLAVPLAWIGVAVCRWKRKRSRLRLHPGQRFGRPSPGLPTEVLREGVQDPSRTQDQGSWRTHEQWHEDRRVERRGPSRAAPVVAWPGGGRKYLGDSQTGPKPTDLRILAWRAQREAVRQVLLEAGVPALLGPCRRGWTLVRVLTVRGSGSSASGGEVVEPRARTLVALMGDVAERLHSSGAVCTGASGSFRAWGRTLVLRQGSRQFTTTLGQSPAHSREGDPWGAIRGDDRAFRAVLEAGLPAQFLDERLIGEPWPIREAIVIPSQSPRAWQAAADVLGLPIRALPIDRATVLTAEPLDGVFLAAAANRLTSLRSRAWVLWRQGSTRGFTVFRATSRAGRPGLLWTDDWELMSTNRDPVDDPLEFHIRSHLRMSGDPIYDPSITKRLGGGHANLDVGIFEPHGRPGPGVLANLCASLNLPPIAADIVEGLDPAKLPDSQVCYPRQPQDPPPHPWDHERFAPLDGG